MIIAIKGQVASYHHAATRQWYGENCEILPCASFADVFASYESGESDAIVTAVENTTYGSINQVYQLIEACSAPIIGEVKLPVHHQLIAAPGTRLNDIREVYSDPVALAQCQDLLRNQLTDAEAIEFIDTAAAVEYIASLDRRDVAAIASSEAAALHHMPIVQADVHDDAHNITRFLVLGDEPTPKDANRASLVITTNHEPGSLVQVLQIFADADVNLAKLQSQPIVGQPWRYKFFIVVETAGDELRNLVAKLEKSDHEVTLLGEYKAAF